MSPTLLVCRLDDPGIRPERCRAVLTRDERERIDRLTSPAGRTRATVARGLLRLELARCLDCDPGALELAYGPQGKPALVPGDRWHFNVSHSGERVVLALAPAAPVGVDVEWRERRTRTDALARHCYPEDEVAALEALPAADRRYRFFQLWTLKEAVTKALGRGLWGTLGDIRIAFAGTAAPELHLDGDAACDEPVAWWHYDLGDGYSLGLAHLAADAGPPGIAHVVPGAPRTPCPLEPDLSGLRPGTE